MLASQKSYGQRGKVVPLGNLCCPGDDNSNSDLGPCGSRTLPPPHHRRTKHICIRTYVRTYVRTHIYVRTYVPLRTYMYICTYVCVYVLNHASLSTDNWIRTHGAAKRVMGEMKIRTVRMRRDRRNIWDRHFKFGTYGSPFLFSLDGAESLRIQHCGSPRDLQEERQYIHVRT